MKRILVIIAFLGALTIILGAFGAHQLKEILDAETLASFETAVRYQMYHVLLLLFVNTYGVLKLRNKKTISVLILLGILFFSGSIYAISFGVDPSLIWFVTPLGGLFFIAGWLKLGITLLKIQKFEKVT